MDMEQNFAESQLGEMPPSDAEDEEKGISGEDTNEDQVKLPIYEITQNQNIEAMIWYFYTIPTGPRGDRRLGSVADLVLRHHEPPGDRHLLPDPHHDLHERQGRLLVRPTKEHARLFFSNDLLLGISRKV